MTEDGALDQLATDYWDAWLQQHPTFATAIGDRRFDALLEDDSPVARAAWSRTLHDLQSRLDRLRDGDEVTRAALRWSLVADRAFLDADTPSFTVDPMDGIQVALLNIPSFHAARTPAEGEALLARWRAMPRAIDVAAESLRRGVVEGRLPVAALCDKVVAQLDALLARPDDDWPLVEPARERPELGGSLRDVVRNEIRPAFARYRAVVADEVRPVARDNDHPGLVHLAGGDATYRALVRAHTTIDTPPEELHEVGLREIERIDGEFIELGRRLLGARDLDSTLERIGSDPALHFATREEIISVAEASLARANATIPDWFGRLPRAACEVVPMPAHEEKHSTIAYYREPAHDGSRPGQYYVNTHAPETRPRYEAEALAFHESVPGHHLQLAIMQELTHLPAFRRFNGGTAFIEGWGLYCERLSDEMGLLSSEMDRFGILSFDSWRACRLVVDTGMHALGWSREQAIAFMASHTALARTNIENEVDRYIGWPGQALAYKVGQLELLRLRAEARRRQADRFDIRRFHDVVLGEGALPLSTLREVVERELS